MRGEYSIVRYVPEPKRGEYVNVGVVLISESQGGLWTRFRGPSSYSNYPPYLRPPNDIIESFERHLNQIPKEEKSVDFSLLLRNLNQDLQNILQTVEPHECT